MRLLLSTFLLVIALSFNASYAHAANPADVARVVKLVKQHPHQGDYQVVFVHKGKKYTIRYTSDDGRRDTNTSLLAVWVRPVGTTDQKSLTTFSDRRTDGIVDFGVGGSGEESCHFDAQRQECKDFGQYFQGLYDQAISAALVTLNHHR
jgi:hypothetical protein